MCPNTLIIGGGIAGMSAALDLADAGGRVFVVERSDHLGGNVARVDLTAPYLDSASDMLTERITRVTEHGSIDVLLESEVRQPRRVRGNFHADIRSKAEGGGVSDRTVDVGSVIVATATRSSTPVASRTTATASCPT